MTSIWKRQWKYIEKRGEISSPVIHLRDDGAEYLPIVRQERATDIASTRVCDNMKLSSSFKFAPGR